MGDLPARTEVVVVGGGVMGASTLYHLAKAGCTDAVLIERDTLGAGSTSKSAGGFRAQFSDELNIRIALESIRRLEQFGDEPGADIDLKQWGYLFLLDADAVASFEASVAFQQKMGVPSRMLTPEDAQAVVPGLRVDDLAAATFCPIDGYATPEAVVQGYASAAVRMGAGVVQGCEVKRVTVHGRHVTGVVTAQGTVAAPVVVCAAGVWSRELAADAGLDLPITPEKRQVWLTDAGDTLPRELPLTIDFATGFYLQRESSGLLFGGRDAGLDTLAPKAMHRVPQLADRRIRPGWWGWYAMSPDHNAIVGAAAQPTGLLYATGFSGHGFQQGPVVGEYLADLALGRTPPIDLAGLSVERFAGGHLRSESNVV